MSTRTRRAEQSRFDDPHGKSLRKGVRDHRATRGRVVQRDARRHSREVGDTEDDRRGDTQRDAIFATIGRRSTERRDSIDRKGPATSIRRRGARYPLRCDRLAVRLLFSRVDGRECLQARVSRHHRSDRVAGASAGGLAGSAPRVRKGGRGRSGPAGLRRRAGTAVDCRSGYVLSVPGVARLDYRFTGESRLLRRSGRLDRTADRDAGRRRRRRPQSGRLSHTVSSRCPKNRRDRRLSVGGATKMPHDSARASGGRTSSRRGVEVGGEARLGR